MSRAVQSSARTDSSGENLGEILVSATGETDEHEFLVEFPCAGEGMCRLERRDDPLEPCQIAERRQRLVVARANVLGPAGIPQPRVLGADARIVEAGGDGMRIEYLAVWVGEDR